MTKSLMRVWEAVRQLLLLLVYANPATAAILQELRVTVFAANAVFLVVEPTVGCRRLVVLPMVFGALCRGLKSTLMLSLQLL